MTSKTGSPLTMRGFSSKRDATAKNGAGGNAASPKAN
jgi:hypothetical protein